MISTKKYFALKKENEILRQDAEYSKRVIEELVHECEMKDNKIENMHEMLCKIEKIALANLNISKAAFAKIVTAARFGYHYSKNMPQFQDPPEDIENCYIVRESERGTDICDCRRWRGFPNCSDLDDCPKKKRKKADSFSH